MRYRNLSSKLKVVEGKDSRGNDCMNLVFMESDNSTPVFDTGQEDTVGVRVGVATAEKLVKELNKFIKLSKRSK